MSRRKLVSLCKNVTAVSSVTVYICIFEIFVDVEDQYLRPICSLFGSSPYMVEASFWASTAPSACSQDFEPPS